ncbi:MAG: hypothetical protein WDM90_20760 [Ferruginibacter sp.]
MRKPISKPTLTLSLSENFTPPPKGMVTLANLDEMAMPVNLSYETKSGVKGMIKLPVEIWNNTAIFKVKLPTTEELSKVEIDAAKVFPDMNFANNVWKAN